MALTKVNEEMIEVSAKLQIGGRTFNAAEIARFESGTTGVILYAEVITASRWTTYREANATAGFQVPVGKTLTVKGVVTTTINASALSQTYLLYGDTDVGQDSAAAPTTPVYVSGFSTNHASFGHTYSASNQQETSGGSYVDFQVPAQKYPCCRLGGSLSTSIIYCFLD